MENIWDYIQTIIDNSRLNEKEKERVISKIDEVLGKNFISYKLPLDVSGLEEEETLVFTKVISALNENRSFPPVKNERQYKMVVDEIMKATNGKLNKRLREKLIELDSAFQDGNWKKVNTILKIISGMV